MRRKIFETITLALIGSKLKTDLYIFDFNDSFTYNIYSTLVNINNDLVIKVISFNDIEITLKNIIGTNQKCGIILGPGPGHPSEYSFIHKHLREILDNPNFFLMGICLGHQILLEFLGCIVTKTKSPIHGQVAHYKLNSRLANHIGCLQDIYVQRYNSHAVFKTNSYDRSLELFKKNDEVIISVSERLLTYQFHPESIGTSCPKNFFMRLVKFLI